MSSRASRLEQALPVALGLVLVVTYLPSLILSNLVKVSARRGRIEEARQLFDELRARFPNFSPQG